MSKWDDEPHPTHPVGSFSRPADRRACVFCPANWDNLDIVERYGHHIIINPLDPVTPGHVLVISSLHTADIGEKPDHSGSLMATAALYAGLTFREYNIITSAGPNATQTVMHTHVHIVPRRENDGLPLPWTPQHELKKLRAIQAMQQINQESSFTPHAGAGLFQQRPRMSYLDALNAEQDAANLRAAMAQGHQSMVGRPPPSLDSAEGLAYDDD